MQTLNFILNPVSGFVQSSWAPCGQQELRSLRTWRAKKNLIQKLSFPTFLQSTFWLKILTQKLQKRTQKFLIKPLVFVFHEVLVQPRHKVHEQCRFHCCCFCRCAQCFVSHSYYSLHYCFRFCLKQKGRELWKTISSCLE